MLPVCPARVNSFPAPGCPCLLHFLETCSSQDQRSSVSQAHTLTYFSWPKSFPAWICAVLTLPYGPASKFKHERDIWGWFFAENQLAFFPTRTKQKTSAMARSFQLILRSYWYTETEHFQQQQCFSKVCLRAVYWLSKWVDNTSLEVYDG